jgi:signal transduction histidine kinase
MGVGVPAIDGDEGALRRALGNLLDNARKYSGPSRWIAVGVEATTLDGRPAVRFAVEDRGLGIEAKERGRIFEPFYRSREAQAGREHGFGLGLSLVQRIVQAHRGVVKVDSVPGEGSVFSIVVPAAKPQEAGATEGEIHGIADSAG